MISEISAVMKEIPKKSVESSEYIKEAKEIAIKEIDQECEILIPDIEVIKSQSLESIEQSNVEKFKLTENQRALIIDETDWSPEIVECIKNMDQYEIYKDARLTEVEVAGRPCLVKKIDFDYTDSKTGLTNRELMEKGRSPIDAETGERIELHHMGQDFYSPFAELCENSEHGDGNDVILHNKKIDSWRQDPELKRQYNNYQRPEHWKMRAMEV